MKNVKRKILTYTVVFEPADEGGFVATVPLLPGCSTQGETFEESIKMIKDAITGYLKVLRDNNKEVPLEKQESVITKVNIPYSVYSSVQ